MESPIFVCVIGPVGSGKSSIVKGYYNAENNFVNVNPDFYPSGIVDRKTKNERILADIRSATSNRRSVVVDNGGGLFVSEPHMFSHAKTVVLVAPVELVDFVSKWPLGKSLKISPMDLAESAYMKGIFRQIETPGPCRDAYLAMVDIFDQRTVQACHYRLANGIFHINYFGSHMKVGHFKNRESMLETMRQVTSANMKHQLVMLMWARLNGHQIMPFTYHSDTHTVSM